MAGAYVTHRALESAATTEAITDALAAYTQGVYYTDDESVLRGAIRAWCRVTGNDWTHLFKPGWLYPESRS